MDYHGRDETRHPPPPSPPPFLMANPSVSSLLTSSSTSRPLGDLDGLVGGRVRNGEPPAAVDGSPSACRKSVDDGRGEVVGENKERRKNPGKMRKITRPRIAFQTRSADDVLDDGYRWRKYGQKAVKNSTYPRSYYRCTHHTCNVKKQVQRLSKDTTIVVTTYEGIHNHPCEKLMETLAPLLDQMQFLSSF
ncbi:hypothetical protein MLD38_036362 [Melastoma candidum]|uniref:Uncharacterized protein n=1 Tax=Melastoma candidum TaxID=119954 RepID=A0ACB9LKE6_9MYRT|nr:hypothetical protein MLD38_036362 [Melastoma candidum]